MKRLFYFGIVAILSLGLVGCKKNNEVVEEPQVAEIPPSPCALYVVIAETNPIGADLWEYRHV